MSRVDASRWQGLRQGLATLRAARLQTHWSVQPLAAWARARLEPRPDDSHTSLEWDADALAFRCQPGSDGTLALLSLPGLALELRGPAGRHRLPLDARTLQEALDWLGARGGPGDASPLELPDYEMPDHAVARGAPIRVGDERPYRELARWYANASTVLGSVRADHEGSSPVRCWPHHFDIATLIDVDPDGSGESARSIGVGMSPGGPDDEDPYFYVTPWPYPPAEYLPALAGGGTWHTEGWVGAVLRAVTIVAAGSEREQATRVSEFLDSALGAARALLAR